MSKDKLTDYDATAGNNTDIGGISVDEGMLPSNVNNAIREMMSHLKDFAAGTEAVTNVKSDTVTADTLVEKTTDNGVTVDGLLIKDKEIGTSAAPATLQASAINGGQIGGRRNLIINGAMNVAQRGTSSTFSNGNAGYKIVDRWLIGEAGTDSFVFDIAQSTDAPDDFAYSYKVDCTTADTSLGAGTQASLEQRIEAQDLQHLNYGTSSAKSLTLSFHVKSSKTGTYIAWFFQDDDSRSISASYTINSANTWEKKTITIAGDTTGVIDNNNEIGLRVRFILFAGTDYTSGTLQTSWGSSSNDADRYVGQVNLADNTSNEWYITGIQLEVGSVATEFEHRSYGEELQLCKRYYNRVTRESGANLYIGLCQGNNATRAYVIKDWEVEMRANPTFSVSATADITVFMNNASKTATAVSLATSGRQNGVLSIDVASGLTRDLAGRVFLAADGDFFDLDAEL